MTKRTLFTRARVSAAALMVAALAGAGAVSGCGASSALDPVAKAAEVSSASAGYRMTFTMALNAGALPGGMTATGTGSFDPPAHAGSFDLAMALPNAPGVKQVFGSGGLQLKEVLKGTAVYVQLPAALTARLPGAAGKSWIKVDLAKLGGQNSALGSLATNPVSGDPSQLLQYLRGAGGMTKLGTEQVAGRSTTHYRGHIDLDQVTQRVPSASRPAVQRALDMLTSEGFAKQWPVDVWVDGQGLVRQMQLRMSGSPSGQAVSATIRVTIPEYGPQPAPAVPPASQILQLPTGAATL